MHATDTWQMHSPNGSRYSWQDVSEWSLHRLPLATDDAVVNDFRNGVYSSADVSIHSLETNSSGFVEAETTFVLGHGASSIELSGYVAAQPSGTIINHGMLEVKGIC